MKHTVVFTAPLPDIATRMLSQEFDIVAHESIGARSEEELMDILADADAAVTLVSDPITRRVMEANPNLRIIANYAVGTNNIDLDAARENGIVVTNTPGVLTEATADLTWSLILAVTRRVIEGDAMMRQGAFTGWHPLLLRGMSLQGKQLGIVGMGRIGSAVAARAEAFGMKVAHTASSSHPEGVRLGELLRTSDIVSLHVPLTEDTRHMIDPLAMKKGSYLINTSRGPLVDEAALADALAAGHLAGAGLDVYEFEPSVEPGLVSMTNVVLLPHLGSATTEARDEMARLVANDIMLFFRGHRPVNQVTA